MWCMACPFKARSCDQDGLKGEWMLCMCVVHVCVRCTCRRLWILNSVHVVCVGRYSVCCVSVCRYVCVCGVCVFQHNTSLSAGGRKWLSRPGSPLIPGALPPSPSGHVVSDRWLFSGCGVLLAGTHPCVSSLMAPPPCGAWGVPSPGGEGMLEGTVLS